VRGRGGGDGGQAAVELVLVLPLVTLLLLLVVQVGLVIRDQILVVHAAREAARQAAVDPDDRAARTAAISGSGLDPDRLRVTISGRGGESSRVRVFVRYRSATAVPGAGAVLGDVILTAEATMRAEK
jgi:Flp pilus assembly protein TadG